MKAITVLLYRNYPKMFKKMNVLFCRRQQNNFCYRKYNYRTRLKKKGFSTHFRFVRGFRPGDNLSRVSVWCRSSADNLRIWQEIIWHCCQNDRLFQNKWPKRLTHATYASDTWSSILQFVHNLFWLKLKWNTRSKLFYCIIYRSSINEVQGHWQN
jgi:hypothetical protein